MIKQIFLLGVLLTNYILAEPISDKDFDGVPDAVDLCPNTPFLCEVNSKGCTTSTLLLPFETEKESLNTSLSYGFSHNDDIKNRELQYNSRININYYLKDWAYTFQAGYYTHNLDSGSLDTIVRIKKRIKLNPELILNVGTGLRLPTYNFTGNKTDELIYASIHYYSTSSLSFFIGYNFSIIGDIRTSKEEEEEENEKLQNTDKFYFSVGYFFSDTFYMNITYNDESLKFTSEHRVQSINSSAYYRISEKWFTTIYYKHDLYDADNHDNLMFSLGYIFW